MLHPAEPIPEGSDNRYVADPITEADNASAMTYLKRKKMHAVLVLPLLLQAASGATQLGPVAHHLDTACSELCLLSCFQPAMLQAASAAPFPFWSPTWREARNGAGTVAASITHAGPAGRTDSKRHNEQFSCSEPIWHQPFSATKPYKNFPADRTWEQTNLRQQFSPESEKRKRRGHMRRATWQH